MQRERLRPQLRIVHGASELPDFAIRQQPFGFTDIGRPRLDPARGAPVGVKLQNGDIVQDCARLAGADRIDHYMPVLGLLPHPDSVFSDRDGFHRAAGIALLQNFVAQFQLRRQRIKDRDRQNAERKGQNRRNQQASHGRNPRRAGDDKFVRPRHRDAKGQARQHDDQRQGLTQEYRHVGQRQHDGVLEGRAATGKPPDGFKQFDQKHQKNHDHEYAEEIPQVAPSQIECKGHAGTASIFRRGRDPSRLPIQSRSALIPTANTIGI